MYSTDDYRWVLQCETGTARLHCPNHVGGLVGHNARFEVFGEVVYFLRRDL